MNIRVNLFSSTTYLYFFLLIVLFGLPCIFLVNLSLHEFVLGQSAKSFTLKNFTALEYSELFKDALFRGIGIALLASAVVLTFSVLFVLAFNEARRITQIIISILAVLLFFFGTIPKIFIVSFLISDSGPLLYVLPFFPMHLYTLSGILLTYLIVLLPINLLILVIARNSIKSEMGYVARELGASWIAVQMKIILPLMGPGIITAFFLNFVLTLADTSVIDTIGGTKFYTISMFILDAVKIDDWGTASAAGVVVMMLVLGTFSVVTYLFSALSKSDA